MAQKKKLNKRREKKVLESAVKLFDARRDIIGFFQKGIFFFKGNVFKTKEEKSEETKEEFINNSHTFIEKKSKDIRMICLRHSSTPIDLATKLFKTEDKKKNSEFIEEMKNKWSKLKDEIEKNSKEEIENEKPNEILGIVNEILDF